MSTTIDDCFAEIETLENDKDQSEILFAQLKTMIDDYELIDETIFFLYSARFFRAKAKFLRSLDNIQSAIKQEQLADLYQKKYEQRRPPTSIKPVPVDSTPENDITEEAAQVRNSFAHLLHLFPPESSNTNMKNIMTNLELVTNDFLSNELCQSFDNYMRLKTLADAIQRNARLLHDPLVDVIGEHLGAIDTFNITIDQYLYRKRVAFAQYLLKNPDALFADVVLLERNIESYTRKVAALFHTDKANNDNDQTLFQQLFVEIYSQKEILLSKIHIGKCRSETVNHFIKLGHEWWHKAIDVSRARKGQWEKIQYLPVDSLRNSTKIELDVLQRDYACQAYEYYRIACHTLGRDGDINEQIELRKFMALSLYVADAKQFRLEAQLYAIAAIHLLVEYTTDFSLDKFNDLQKLVLKIQGEQTNTSTKTDDPVDTPLKSGELVLHPSTARGAAIARRDIRSAVAEDKRRVLLRQCLLRSANHSIHTAVEPILEAKLQATRSLVSGVAAALGGSAITTGIGIKIYADVMTGFAAGSVIGPVGSIIGASLGLVSGGFMGYFLFKKSHELCEEPEIREELNNILADASKCFQEGNIDEFFKKLSQPYAGFKKRLIKISLVEDHVELKVDAEMIVQTLLSHEFRPDGIAYLLILIGEGLMSGPTLTAEKHSNRLDTRSANVEASKLFREVFTNAALQERAIFLDSKVIQIKLEDRAKYVRKLFQSFNRTVYSIPKEYFDDAITTPFTTRLAELSQIGRLNFAISHIIEGEQENLKRSYAAIQRLKFDLQNAKHQHFFQLSELRINALEDLLAAFGFFDETMNKLAITTQNLLSIENSTSIELITKVATSTNSFSTCERVLAVDNPTQGITMLELLLTTIARLGQRRMSDQASKKTLSLDNLSEIANYYHVNFRLCRIESHPIHSHVFVPKDELIACRQSATATCIYLVLDDRQKTIIGMFVTAEPRINYLLQQLTTAKTDTERVDLNIQIAQVFRERAERAEAQHHLLALSFWFDALKYYETASNLINHPVATLGFLRCMIMLGRYARADNTLRNLLLTTMITSGEAWYLRAVACRKQIQFSDAHFCARESVRLGYGDAQKELKLCEKLKTDSIEDRIAVYKRMTTRYSTINRAYPSYNILSIDGGGCRGIIPAFWLTELERLTKRPCASLFHMMAGTSTGAIISTALATPAIHRNNGPRYSAFDVLQLYRTQTSSVFSLQDSMFGRLGAGLGKSARYCDKGRIELFQQYFEDTCLTDLLVDTVIPAVTSASNATCLFTYHRNAGLHQCDYKVKDILMCTTAAPTYFEPYKLGSNIYVDGGVQANNPTMEAFAQALVNGIRQENIYVLSLGTGDYVPDPLHLNASRNLLFWAANSETVAKVIFDGPQSNIDLNMSRLVTEERYHRWQVWLEKPITLDDTSENNLNMLSELAREQFEAMNALDNQKRLGLFIDHLKGDDFL